MPQRHSKEHKFRMLTKVAKRSEFYDEFHNLPPNGFIPSYINRRTLEPHKHEREISRRPNKAEKK